MKKEIVIDTKIGRVTTRCKEDTVILKGDYLYDDSKFVENCKIVIKNDGGIKEYPIEISGYNLKLFLGHFSRRQMEDIFVCGQTGGSGGYVIGILYQYDDGELKQIFNGNNFFDEYNCKGKYLECYKVKIICNNYKKEYILDISDRGKEALKSIYNKDGKVITNENPTVSYMNKIEVVNTLQDNFLKLQIYERIIGSNNSQTLGYIRQLVSISDTGYKVIDQDAITKGKDIIKSNETYNIKHKIQEYIPKGGVIIALNTGNDFIIKDIDNDGRQEILCEYKLDGDTYLVVFREENGIIKKLDTVRGEGYNISDLIIMPFEENINKIIIGWQVGAIWSELNILEFKDNKFKKLLISDKIYYSKMEIVKYSDGAKEIALWSHSTGEAFDVQLYSFKGNTLQKTSKHDKEYFVRVYEYYKNVIDNSKDKPKYLYYYLANAAYKIGKKEEAIIYINKALEYPGSAPSIKELKDLENKIKG